MIVPTRTVRDDCVPANFVLAVPNSCTCSVVIYTKRQHISRRTLLLIFVPNLRSRSCHARCIQSAWAWALPCLAEDDYNFLATPCMHDTLVAKGHSGALSAPLLVHLTNMPSNLLDPAMGNQRRRLSPRTPSSFQAPPEQDSLATKVTISAAFKLTPATSRASTSVLFGAITSAA